jgi:multicomponent Na+:H+ antiporter subunit D
MPGSATAGGFLLVLAIVLPVSGAILALALGGRHVERVALIVMPMGVVLAVAIGATVWRTRDALQYFVGGWDPPLGVAFRADGLSAAMLVTAALLMCGIGLFARGQFPSSQEVETRAALVFWTLLLAVWGALNAVFIGGDLFNLYVALELLTFAAVPLVSLDGRADTLTAASATCCSRSLARFSICSARWCFMVPTARSILSCCRAASAPSPRRGLRSR